MERGVAPQVTESRRAPKRGSASFSRALGIALAAIAFPACALAQPDARRTAPASEPLSPATERAVAAISPDARARFTQGLALLEQGKSDQAFDIFFALTQDYPEFAEPYNNLAVLYAARGDYERARSALEMAILANPQYGIAHENLGDVHSRLASRAYAKAAQIDAENRSARAKLRLALDLLSYAPRRDGISDKGN
jgi:tetratricopeptide (TPR) repeat protein